MDPEKVSHCDKNFCFLPTAHLMEEVLEPERFEVELVEKSITTSVSQMSGKHSPGLAIVWWRALRLMGRGFLR